MEADSPCPLPPASWRTRKADGISQSESEGLRTRELFLLSPKALFVRTLSGFHETHSHLWGSLLRSLIQMLTFFWKKIFFFWYWEYLHFPCRPCVSELYFQSENTLIDTQRNSIWQLSGHLLAQSNWHIKLISHSVLKINSKWVKHFWT